MVTIRLGKPVNLPAVSSETLSAFVTFQYNVTIGEIVKQLSTRFWDSKLRAWEIPVLSVPVLVKKLSGYDVEILGQYVEGTPALNLLPPNFSFKTTPFTHQIEGVLYGLNHQSFILGDEQGLGKTKQVIDIAVALKQMGLIKRCLIICGVNSLKYNWANEIALHSNEKSWVLGTRIRKQSRKQYEGDINDKIYDITHVPDDIFFVITNIETIRGAYYVTPGYENKKYKKYTYPVAELINQCVADGDYGMIAFDEFHKVRNPDTHQGKALLSLDSHYKIPMTGTPLVNSPLDAYIALRWTGADDHTFYDFKRHYCRFGGFNNGDIVGFQHMDELHAMLQQTMLRRKKDDVLDLPPKIYTDYNVDMYADQLKLYNEIKLALKKQLSSIRLSNDPLAQIIRLRQTTAYPGIVSKVVINSAKMDFMVELVDEIVASGNKCLVFSNWEEVTWIAKQKLSKYNPAYLTGQLKPIDRPAEEARFQTDDTCSVAIGTIGVMGTGLTLTAATYVIFLDEPWNRAIKDQAVDRTHRIGTRGTINVITLMSTNTVDTWVHDIVNRKGAMADLLIDGKVDTPESRQQLLADIERLLS